MLSLNKINTKNYITKEKQAFLWGSVTFSLILAGLFLRLYLLTSRSLWLDEALCVKIAAITDFSEMLRAVIGEIHPPLFYILLHFWIALFGNSDTAVRLFSLGWGCIGLYGIYFLCRYGLNWTRKASNLATLFAVILPIHAYYSQEVRPYSMLFALSCFALSFLFHGHIKRKMHYYILFGIFQALLLYVHHTALIYCFVMNVLYLLSLVLYKQVKWFRLKGILLSGIVCFFLYLPWLPFLFKQLKNPILFSGFWFWITQPSPEDLLNVFAKIIGVWSWNLPFNVPGLVHFILIIPILILMFSGFLYAQKSQHVEESLLAIGIIGYPLFIYFLSHVILPVWLIRILVPSAIGVPIIAGFGAKMRLFQNRRNSAFMVVTALYVLVNLFTSLNLLHSYQKEDWKGAAKFLSRSVKKSDSVLVYREFYTFPLERYINPEIDVKRVDIQRESSSEDLSNKLAEKVINLSDNSKKIYLVLAKSDVPSRKLIFLMDKTHKILQRKPFYGLEILVFKTMPAK